MAEAIELARRATGRTHPNPMVGCVIVRDNEIVGRGYHTRAGEPHAEVAALDDAPGDVTGCEMFVNHEPCCHVGRTPPCTDAILDAGIGRVVVGTIDPDPRVSGQGIEILSDAGVDITCGVLEEESRRLNAPFFKYIEHGLPWVAAKWAMSLDGKIATRTGDSRWITDEAARRRVHELRDHHDAILVGHRTLMVDDPRLTCRLDGGRDPVRFVIDTRLEAPVDHRIFNHDDSTADTITFVGPDADDRRRQTLESRGVETVEIPVDERGWLDLEPILKNIGDRGLLSLLVEGGGTLLGSLFDAGFVDYAYGFVAPRIIGGTDAPTPFGGDGITTMAECLELTSPTVEHHRPDLLIHGAVGNPIDPSTDDEEN